MSDPNNTWYLIDNVDELDSPALVVFPDRVKQNIAEAIKMVGDVDKLRPHVKTHKSANAAQLMMDAGISKFKCATIAEAEMLAQCGAKDILLAYQPLGPKLNRFISLIQKYPESNFACLTDNISAAKEQSTAFATTGITVDIFIDINVGMNRTGIVPGEEAIRLYKFCTHLAGFNVRGLHAYDGHVRDADFEERKKSCDIAFARTTAMKESLQNDGIDVPVIIAGGSPGFSIHCKRTEIECSPGTFVYWDKSYSDLCPEQKFVPAAVLVTRIISLPTEDTICLDLGHKSVAAENEIGRRVYFLNAPELEPISQSEEHLVVQASKGHSYKPGDVLYALPFHICPTVALYEKVYTVENGMTNGSWRNVARDRMISL
jgi:D-serine deaminase-like pyridoxal phosphate-dependent protein